MQRMRLGIITTSEREGYFKSAFETCDILFNTEWFIDPYTDIANVLEDWIDAKVDAAIIDEEALVFTPASYGKLQQWVHNPSASNLPIVFIGLNEGLRDTPLYQSFDNVALGGILYPSNEPSVSQAILSRLDSLSSSRNLSSYHSRTRVGSMLESSINEREHRNTAKEEAEEMFMNRKRHAQDVEKEIYESLGGRNERTETASAEDFFASTPTPSYPESDDRRMCDTASEGGRPDAVYHLDEARNSVDPPIFNANGTVDKAQETFRGATPKPESPFASSLQAANQSENGSDLQDSAWRPATPDLQGLHAANETDKPSAAYERSTENRSKESSPNTEEILEKLDMLLDQFKLLDKVEGVPTASQNSEPSFYRNEPAVPVSKPTRPSEGHPRVHAKNNARPFPSEEPSDSPQSLAPVFNKKTQAPTPTTTASQGGEQGHPQGDCLISVAGLQSNCGHVYLGIIASLWLAGLGYKTCFVFSDKMQFMSMRSALDVRDLRNGSFRFDQCDFFCWNKDTPYSDSYDYVVIDCGSLVFSNHSKSFMKERFCAADVSIVCASGAPWNVYLIAETLKTIQAKELVRWRWFFLDAPQRFIAEIKPAFNQLKKRVSRTTDFNHLYLLNDTSTLDPSNMAPVLESALYNALPASMRSMIRKQAQATQLDRE